MDEKVVLGERVCVGERKRKRKKKKGERKRKVN